MNQNRLNQNAGTTKLEPGCLRVSSNEIRFQNDLSVAKGNRQTVYHRSQNFSQIESVVTPNRKMIRFQII